MLAGGARDEVPFLLETPASEVGELICERGEGGGGFRMRDELGTGMF